MTSKKHLLITRVFDAPRKLVWQAWTNPGMMMKWWGPKNFTSPVCKIDFRVGGKYLSCMRGEPAPGTGLKNFWSTGTYKEIVPMEKIVCTDSFADAEGNVVPASYYGMPGSDWPLEMEVTVVLEDVEGGKTKMTLRHVGLPGGVNKDQTSQGWNQSFDKLMEILK